MSVELPKDAEFDDMMADIVSRVNRLCGDAE